MGNFDERFFSLFFLAGELLVPEQKYAGGSWSGQVGDGAK